MNIEKYKALKQAIPSRYQIKLRFNNGKLGLDVYKGDKFLKATQRSGMKTTYFKLYGDCEGKLKGYTVSKYELFCFISGVDVVNREVTLEYINKNIDKIKKYARKELIQNRLRETS